MDPLEFAALVIKVRGFRWGRLTANGCRFDFTFMAMYSDGEVSYASVTTCYGSGLVRSFASLLSEGERTCDGLLDLFLLPL